MVKIENIVRSGNIVSFDCFEEGDRSRAHHVEFDVDTLQIQNGVESNMYIRQSIAKLWKILEVGDELPSTASSYWC